MVQDRAIVIIEYQSEVIIGLLYGAISNDIECHSNPVFEVIILFSGEYLEKMHFIFIYFTLSNCR